MTWRAPTQGGVATVANIAQPVTITINAVATAQTAGLTLENNTAAAAGAQQYSPMVLFEGQGWYSTASLSKTVEFAIQNRPVQAAGNPTGVLDFLFRSNAGAWTKPMTLTDQGVVTFLGKLVAGGAAGVALQHTGGISYIDGVTALKLRVSEVDAVAFAATSLDATFTGKLTWVAGNEQLTVGAAGAASAPPATPTKYLKIKDSAGTTLVVPCYAAV